jgi:vancomycin resistance protein YoaR
MAALRVPASRLALLSALVVALAGVLAVFVAPESIVRAGTLPAKAGPTEVTVEGAPIDLAGDLRAQARELGRAWMHERLALLGPDGRRIVHGRAWWGGSVDADELVRLLMAAKDSGSLMRRVHAEVGEGAALDLPLPVSFDASRALAVVTTMKDDLDRRPRDARLDTATHEVRPHEDGLRVDVWRTAEAIERALREKRAEARVVAEVLRAHRSEADLAGVSMDAVLGTFDTHYDASYESEDRTFNLRVAASKIDGLVLLPGEELDFNEVVGERNEANGFRVAKVIAAGELVDGIGGGTCQISGTLHAAVFFAGLPVLERRPHSRPSSYIKLGLDAAVSYPSLNFRFRNDRDFPIVIGFSVDGGIARATLYGRETHTQVTFVRRIDEVIPFEERTVDDPELPRGVRVLAQRGIPGFELTRYRIVRDVRTNQAVRERLEDEYPPTTQLYRVGTGGAAPEGFTPPAGDTHLEYVADEFLELTMGAGVEGALETRRAGRTGAYGWMARMGLPVPAP